MRYWHVYYWYYSTAVVLASTTGTAVLDLEYMYRYSCTADYLLYIVQYYMYYYSVQLYYLLYLCYRYLGILKYI